MRKQRVQNRVTILNMSLTGALGVAILNVLGIDAKGNRLD